MSNEKIIKDRLGPLPAELFENDYHPDPAISVPGSDDLTESERLTLERVMRAFPDLTREEAIKHLRDAGL